IIGLVGGVTEIEAADFGVARERLKDNGDGALGNILGKLAHAGKGFGGKEIALTSTGGVADTTLEAAREDSAEEWTLAAGAGADGGLKFVQQDGRDDLVGALAQAGGSVAGGERRLGGNHAKQLQAKALSGLLLS